MVQPLLSICIPTYNRADFLFEALKCLLSNLENCHHNVEIIISDNCSSDNTSDVVNSYISQGLRCIYISNQTNIGPDCNFVQCFHKATGQYVWLIGDDDYLEQNALNTICNFLIGKQYGLVHVQNDHSDIHSIEYTNIGDFLSRINIMITFMSVNIINRSIVNQVDATQYYKTFLVQMPYFVTASLSKPQNLFINGSFLSCGHKADTNGGYNFSQVFMVNYFSIWNEFLEQGLLTTNDFNQIKRLSFERFHLDYIFRTLIGKPSQSLDMSGCRRLTLIYFGTKLYLYVGLLRKFKDLFKSKLFTSGYGR